MARPEHISESEWELITPSVKAALVAVDNGVSYVSKVLSKNLSDTDTDSFLAPTKVMDFMLGGADLVRETINGSTTLRMANSPLSTKVSIADLERAFTLDFERRKYDMPQAAKVLKFVWVPAVLLSGNAEPADMPEEEMFRRAFNILLNVDNNPR